MLLGLGVSVLFGHAKVYNVDDIRRFRARSTDEEVVWLDVSIYQVLFVNCLYTGKLGTVSQ
jgi:hypothetical protein